MADTYDPVTCITAAEVREMGVVLSAEIPNFAWMPRTDVQLRPAGDPTYDEATKRITTPFVMRFLSQWRWVEQKFGFWFGDG